MNNIDMIIINGIKSIAKYTYDHKGREAKSVIDYVAVSRSLFGKTSEITYVDNRNELDTDHIFMHTDVEKETDSVALTNSQRPPKQRTKPKASRKSAMNKLRSVRRKDPFWKALAGVCDKNFENYTVNK